MSSLNISELLNALDNEDHNNLIDTTFASIAKDKNDILQKLQFDNKTLKTMHSKLKDYRYIDELNDLKYGQYVRWINIKDPDNLRLTNGGIFLDLKILDTGVHLLCKNRMNRMFQIKLVNITAIKIEPIKS